MHHLNLNPFGRADSIAAAALAALLIAAGSLATVAATTAPADLEGAWSGGGKIHYPSGETESARCRARFTKRGGSGYSMTAVCATPSARVEQTATLSRSGPNRFAGDFQNSEYGISGSIHITVNGNSLSASLNGGGGSASFSLSR